MEVIVSDGSGAANIFRKKGTIKGDVASKFISSMLGMYSLHISSRVLEVECGDGSDIRRLRSDGFYVDGTDRSLDLLELAKKKNSDSKLYLVEPDGNWGLINRKYDSAFIIMSFSSKIDPYKLCENVSDVVRPGGLFVFDYANADVYYSLYDDTSSAKFVGNEKHKYSIGNDKKEIVIVNRSDGIWDVASYLRPGFDIIAAYSAFTENAAKWRDDKRISIIARRVGG